MAIVCTLLPCAALGARVGHARVYPTGMALFTAASLACAGAPTLPARVVARATQGLGAAGLMSVNGALLRYIYPTASLGRRVGLNALIISLGSSVGPTLAAGILLAGPWPWLFAINVPLGLVGLGLGWRVLPATDRSAAPLDLVSAALNALVFGLTVIAADLLTGARPGAGTKLVAAVAMLAVAAALGIVLWRRERAVPAPLVPLDLLRDPIFALPVAASLSAFAALLIAFVLLPFFFQIVMGRDQVETGLMMTPWPVALGLMAPVAGRLADGVSAGVLGGLGMAAVTVALLALAFVSPHVSTLDAMGWMALAGAGYGLFQSPNNRTMFSAAPRTRVGAASGMLATARLTGMTTGAAIAAIVLRVAIAPERVGLALAATLALVAGGLSVLRQARGVPSISKKASHV